VLTRVAMKRLRRKEAQAANPNGFRFRASARLPFRVPFEIPWCKFPASINHIREPFKQDSTGGFCQSCRAEPLWRQAIHQTALDLSQGSYLMTGMKKP
jgi:hypothetical protein